MRDLVGWLADQEAVDRVDAATVRARRARTDSLERARARPGDHRRLDERGSLAPARAVHRLRPRGRVSLDVVVADNRVDRRHPRACRE